MLTVQTACPLNALRTLYSLGREKRRKFPDFLEVLPKLKAVTDFASENCNSSVLSSRSTDPLVHHGRHFGRTVHALCNIHALISNGIIRLGEQAEEPEEEFTAQ